MKIAVYNEPASYKKFADKEDKIPTDWIIEGPYAKFALERKESSDLVASARDGRLWQQCKDLQQLKDQGYTVMVVVVGRYDWRNLKWSHTTLPQYLGIKIAVIRMGMPLLEVDTKSDFKYLINLMNAKAGKKPVPWTAPTIAKKGRTIEEERLDMLTAVDGIGPARAKDILSVCLTLGSLIRTEGKGPGLELVIGEKLAKHLQEVIG